MTTNIQLNVLDIYLDSENPRHKPISDQKEIIEYLIKKEKIKPLAKHISMNGISPLELTGVIKNEDDVYVVVEGNRRLCSLVLLNDPDRSPLGDVAYFKSLTKSNDKIPDTLNCILFDNLEEANTWIALRHDGEQDGIGIRKWDSEQKARNNARIDKRDPNALAQALLDYATVKGYLPDQREERIMTTAARYLGNPFFRNSIGIVSSRSEKLIQINVECQAFDHCLAKFCSDLLENKEVNSRSNKEDWERYAQILFDQGYVPKLKTGTRSIDSCLSVVSKITLPPLGERSEETLYYETAPLDGSPEDLENYDQGVEVLREPSTTKNPDNRKYIIPSDFKVAINNKILRRVYEEMKSIEVNTNPLAVSLLTRAFLENIYSEFYERVCGKQYNSKLKTHEIMDTFIKQIELDTSLSKIEKNALAALKRVQSNESNPLSPKTLGANAHAGIYPDSTALKREFDNIAEIVKYALKRL